MTHGWYSVREVLASQHYDYIRELSEVEQAEKEAERELEKERQKWQKEGTQCHTHIMLTHS